MSTLRPFWERNTWLIRPAAIALLIVSPIAFPIMAIVTNWDAIMGDLRDWYRECLNLAKKGYGKCPS